MSYGTVVTLCIYTLLMLMLLHIRKHTKGAGKLHQFVLYTTMIRVSRPGCCVTPIPMHCLCFTSLTYHTYTLTSTRTPSHTTPTPSHTAPHTTHISSPPHLLPHHTPTPTPTPPHTTPTPHTPHPHRVVKSRIVLMSRKLYRASPILTMFP